MKRFLHSVQIALKAGDWYGALSTALTLPDICGRIEAPEQGSKARYIDWFNRYLRDHYTAQIGPERKPHVFLHGEDCYALRCSYLHEGGGTIIEQRARKALDSFHFITPPPNGSLVHMNQSNNVLQLQVDIFCKEMCAAVEQWMNSFVKGNSELEGRLKSLLEIHDSQKGILF
jgi:hypothetical protein